MFRKIQTRYMAVIMLMVTLSYIVFGTMFVYFTQRTITDQKESTLEQTSSYAEQLIGKLADNAFPVTQQNMVLSSIEILTQYTDSNMTVCSVNGDILFSTKDQEIVGETVADGMMHLVNLEDGTATKTTIIRLHGKSQFIRARIVKSAYTDEPVAIIFATASAEGYSSVVRTFIKTFWIVAMVALLVSYVLLYFVTHQLVKPISQMTRAAKKYARGEFDERISESKIDEVNNLGTAFNNMADSLAKNEDMRHSFLQNVSHDLRTPMTTISGFVDGILDGTIPPDQYNYYLSLVSNETKRLSRLVSTLLEIGEIQDGHNDAPVVFDAVESIRQVILSFENKIVDKKLSLKFDFKEEELKVIGDKDALYRVIYNLVDNAIKYSFDEGAISVSTDRNSDFAIITVHNTGMGISDGDIPFVFDRFYKADKSRGRDTKSLGLGLYITKTIVEKNGGTIVVRSRYGEYCEFSFTLPLSK